jgi:hypothetical protein
MKLHRSLKEELPMTRFSLIHSPDRNEFGAYYLVEGFTRNKQVNNVNEEEKHGRNTQYGEQ